MTPEDMEEVRPRLDAFASEMFGSLPRRDQRAKGELYLRGLMLDGKPAAEEARQGGSAHLYET
ncbi:hypothetical protein [Streptomyces sp. NPDC001978]|uniref:hypothetical protein n=1 Tax=Streptomyces sp. NPDC001978 TaxID=3364627 RepID=UPI00367A94DD